MAGRKGALDEGEGDGGGFDWEAGGGRELDGGVWLGGGGWGTGGVRVGLLTTQLLYRWLVVCA